MPQVHERDRVIVATTPCFNEAQAFPPGKRSKPVMKPAATTLATGRPLAWADWARLTKLDAGARWKGVAQAVVTAAEAHAGHPRLRDDLRTLVEGVFLCAPGCCT